MEIGGNRCDSLVGALSQLPIFSSNTLRNYPEKNFHRCEQDTTESDYYIHYLTPTDGTVLDCMMGTGTIGVSTVKYGRKFIGIEIDKERFEIARGRILRETLESISYQEPSITLTSAI